MIVADTTETAYEALVFVKIRELPAGDVPLSDYFDSQEVVTETVHAASREELVKKVRSKIKERLCT